MSILPEIFPQFPESIGSEWPANFLVVHDTISNIYRRAFRVSNQEDADPLQLAFHHDAIAYDAVPLLQAIEDEPAGHQLQKWLRDAATLLGNLCYRLSNFRENIRNRPESNVEFPQPVTVIKTGQRGRPQKSIDLDFLKEAVSDFRQIKLTELANVLGLHRNTLRLYMKRHGIVKQYSQISNSDLDDLIASFKRMRPDSGIRYTVGFLRRHGIRVQYRRVTQALRRIDRLGQIIRDRQVRRRRKYRVKRPNALWHLDGHHKLIRWGIVIHGIIDGYCRTVTALQANNNNQAVTVLDLFKRAVDEHGMPSRVRGDRGGENIDVATYVIMRNGPRRASFMWGSSTRNTRIERLWVEIGTQFARRWRAFFTRLEKQHMLDVHNPHHIWLLHTLFLDDINRDCHDFQHEWNCHPISGPDTNNKSPQDMRFLGQLQFGIYRDDCENVHPDIINEYYGVDGPQLMRQAHQTGAGHPEDEEENLIGTTNGTIVQEIVTQQMQQVHHEAVRVLSGVTPFVDPNLEDAFYAMLHELVMRNITPDNFRLRAEEWEDGHYPIYETIHIGRRGLKDLHVSLADPIWYNRACLWCQALVAMSYFLDTED